MQLKVGWFAAILGFTLATGDTCGAEPFPESPLDRLDRSSISADELDLIGAGKAPDELVAIIGSGKFSHWGDITDVVVSPDGKYLVTAGDDRFVRAWDSKSGRQLWRIDDPHRHSRGIAVSPDGLRFANCRGQLRDDETIYTVVDLRDIASGNVVRRFSTGDVFESVAFNRDGSCLAAANDDHIVVWNSHSGQQQSPQRKGSRRVAAHSSGDWRTTTRLAFSPDGELVVGAINRHDAEKPKRDAMRVWDARTGMPLLMIAGRVGRAPFLADGTLLSAAFDGAVFLLNPREGTIVRQLVPSVAEDDRPFGYDGPGPPLLLPGERKFALSSGTIFDKKVTTRIISLDESPERRRIEWPEPPDDPITALDVSSDGKTMVIGGQSRLRFWNVETGNEEWSDLAPFRKPGRIAFSRDESWLAIGSLGSQVVIWDFAKAGVANRLGTGIQEIKALAVSPDNRWLLIGGDESWFSVWDTSTWAEVRRLSTRGWDVSHIHYLEAGRTVLTVSTFGDGTIWNAADWKSASPQPWKLTTKHLGLNELAVAPTGDQVAATLEPKVDLGSGIPQKGHRSLTLWHFPGGTARQTTIQKAAFSIAFSPDGKLIAGGLGNSLFDSDTLFKPETSIAVWHLNEKTAPKSLYGHSREVMEVEFSPDGTRLASVSADGKVGLWDVKTWKLSHTIAYGPREGSWGSQGKRFCFSPSGRHVAICNSNGTVYVLRIAKPTLR